MTKLIIVTISYSLLAVSSVIAMNSLSDIVKQCFAHNHQVIQTNYIYTQRDDDFMHTMAEILTENQEQFIGSSNW